MRLTELIKKYADNSESPELERWLNENIHKYVDLPIVESLRCVVDLSKEIIMKKTLLIITALLFITSTVFPQ
ncbi:hypothetical protein HOM13_03925, partial [Candidatus Woesearchaeota archaeon]|nr:hypothetical protein [Candidatus Woesearchaeota archaeon]